MLMNKFELYNKSKKLIISIGVLHLLCLSIRETFIVTPLIMLLAIPLAYKNNKISLKKIFLISSLLMSATVAEPMTKAVGEPLWNISVQPFSWV